MLQSSLMRPVHGLAEISGLTGMHLPITPDSHEAGITEPVERFLEPMIVDVRPFGDSANFLFLPAYHRAGHILCNPNAKYLGIRYPRNQRFSASCRKKIDRNYAQTKEYSRTTEPGGVFIR